MYAKKNESDMPGRERSDKGESRFQRTPAWPMMKKDIDKGIPPGKYLEVQLTAADKAEYGIKSRRTVARFVQKYLAEQGHEYAVKSVTRGGVDYVMVHRPE